MFLGGIAQGFNEGVDSNRDWQERQQLMQVRKLAMAKAQREEDDESALRSADNMLYAPAPEPGASSAPPQPPGGQMQPPGGQPQGPPQPYQQAGAQAFKIPSYNTVAGMAQEQTQPAAQPRVATPQQVGGQQTQQGVDPYMASTVDEYVKAVRAKGVTDNHTIAMLVKRDLPQIHAVAKQKADTAKEEMSGRKQDEVENWHRKELQMQGHRADISEANSIRMGEQFNKSLARRDRGLDQNDKKIGLSEKGLIDKIRHEGVNEAQHGEALKIQAQRASGGAKALSDMGPEQLSALGALARTGMPMAQVFPGYGNQAGDVRKAIQWEAIKQMVSEEGISYEEAGVKFADQAISYAANKRSASQLTTMQNASDQAVKQLDFNIGKTKAEIKKLGSSDLSPVINAIARGEQKWTGEPAYSSLYFYMHATAMESARILAGGAASIAQLQAGAAEEAKNWANVGMTPASFDAVAEAMHDEGVGRQETFKSALEKTKFSKGKNLGVGGKSEFPDPRTDKNPPKTVVKTGTKDGRKVNMYSDGTIDYAD